MKDMKKKLVILFLLGIWILIPKVLYAQEEGSGPPSTLPPERMIAKNLPIEQPLVPEGIFAVQLAQALKIGKVQEEAQAEDMLSARGIEPKNGWIAGYPVTPDIVAEIQNSVGAAVEAKKLEIGKDEARKAIEEVLISFGLNIRPGDPQAMTGQADQVNPPAEMIDNYYYDYGPPVVTYYPPPWDYDYLYSWVPFPFWWGGFFVGGFFVLHDFHRHVFFHDRPCLVTNHVFNAATTRVSVVNPTTRALGTEVRATIVAPERSFSSSKFHSSARSIVARSEGRLFSGDRSTRPGMGNRAPSTPGSKTEESFRSPHVGNTTRRGASTVNREPQSLEGSGSQNSQPSSGQRVIQPRNESGSSRASENRVPSSRDLNERSFGLAPAWSSHPAPASPGRVSTTPFTGSRGAFGGFHGSGGSSGGFHASAPSSGQIHGGEKPSGGFHEGGGSFGGFHGGGGSHR